MNGPIQLTWALSSPDPLPAVVVMVGAFSLLGVTVPEKFIFLTIVLSHFMWDGI